MLDYGLDQMIKFCSLVSMFKKILCFIFLTNAMLVSLKLKLTTTKIMKTLFKNTVTQVILPNI